MTPQAQSASGAPAVSPGAGGLARRRAPSVATPAPPQHFAADDQPQDGRAGHDFRPVAIDVGAPVGDACDLAAQPVDRYRELAAVRLDRVAYLRRRALRGHQTASPPGGGGPGGP